MSKAADISDAIVVLVQTQLPTFARLPNPYDISENTATLLKKSFGVAIGPGLNTERYVGCLVTWQRSYTINLIRQVVNTENDTVGRFSVEKNIDDARDILFKAFEANSTLDGLCIKAIVTDDSGIQYIDGQQSKFLAVELSLAVEYQETLT